MGPERCRELEARLALITTALQVEPLVVVGVDDRGNVLVCEGGAAAATTQIPQVGENIFTMDPSNPIALGLRNALGVEDGDSAMALGDRRFIASFRRTDAGEHRGAACLGMDVTAAFEHQAAATEMQSKLLQMQKLESLGVLAGGIAHDFNNLLTAIIGNATLAQLELPEDSPVHATLQDILLTSRRAATLSRQMLAYSGKGHFEVKHVDLSQQVTEIAHLLEATLPKKVEVKLDLASAPLALEVDVAQFQQIVMNLVINAAEAIGSKAGVVTVRTGEEFISEVPNDAFVDPGAFLPGRYAYVEVQDNGTGMSLETRGKIFDPFFTTKFSGRGLGLAAVLGAVRGHRGLIRIESTLGEGSTFRALLPASDQAPEKGRSQPPVNFQGSGVILIVDDESVVRSAARRILQRMGFATLEATNGREGVEMFAAHADDISAVILDMTMPEMGGDEALRQMRAIDPDAIVLVSSGYNDVEAGFVDAPPNGFLLKPYTPAELSERLRSAIRMREEA
jgi:signal transduction histidine kinase/CheY-like chemotaxis protein